MPRSISSALQTVYNSAVGQPLYLIQINCSQILRWSSGGDVTVGGVPWVAMDFNITGLGWSAGSPSAARLIVKNLDNAVAGLFLNENMADAVLEVYLCDRAALTDPQDLGAYVFDDVKITLEQMEAGLVSTQSAYAKSPRRYINSLFGFNYGLPRGTQIAWGNEIFVVEPE